MIQLNLGIGEGDVKVIELENVSQLLDYTGRSSELMIEGVWLATGRGRYSEIFITDNIDMVSHAIGVDLWEELNDEVNSIFHIHHYDSFEDAYKVALDMREGHELCYNSQVKTKVK